MFVFMLLRYGNVAIELTGSTTLVFEITGTGEIATLVRSMVTGTLFYTYVSLMTLEKTLDF